MKTNVGIGVPEFTDSSTGHVRQVHDKIDESNHVISYLNGLHQTQEYFQSRKALSNIEAIIGENMKHWTNPFAADFASCFNRGGMVGIDIATTMLHAASTTKIADCIQWASERIMFEATSDPANIDKENLAAKLLEYGQMSDERYDDTYLELPGEISELIAMNYADEESGSEVDEHYIELGMGFVLNAVSDYADIWDYLATSDGIARQDADHNRLLYEV